MNRLLILFPLILGLLQAAEEHEAHGGGDPLLTYKWINFGILVVALAVLISKTLIPALKARSAQITHDLEAARKALQEADAKIAGLETKLKNFDGELAGLRAQSAAEREREGKRISEQTKAALAKLELMREVEIANATKIAEHELRVHTIQHALALAETQLQAGAASEQSGKLVAAFLSDLKKVEAPKA